MLKTITAASLVLMSTPLMAQDGENPVAQAYAETYNVSVQEAARRLAAIENIAKVEKDLEAKFPNQFGGLFIEDAPQFQVVVLMTGGGQGLLRQITDDPLYVVRKADRPINQLRQLAKRMEPRVASLEGSYAIEVNVFDGVVEIKTENEAGARELLSTELGQYDYLRIVQLEEPITARATVRGGSLQGDCTAGYTAKKGTIEGIITAGHCDNTSTNQSGVAFRNSVEAYASNDAFAKEWQFMVPSSGTHTFENVIYRGSSTTMSITQIYDADNLPIGTTVCTYGSETKVQLCGKTTTKRVKVRDNFGVEYPAFGYAVSTLSGDSGAPVYGNLTAYGMHTASTGSTGYFVDIGDLPLAMPGVSIKTAP